MNKLIKILCLIALSALLVACKETNEIKEGKLLPTSHIVEAGVGCIL